MYPYYLRITYVTHSALWPWEQNSAQFFCFIPMATWYHFVVMLSANIDEGSSKICQALSGLEDAEMKEDKVCLYA